MCVSVTSARVRVSVCVCVRASAKSMAEIVFRGEFVLSNTSIHINIIHTQNCKEELKQILEKCYF